MTAILEHTAMRSVPALVADACRALRALADSAGRGGVDDVPASELPRVLADLVAATDTADAVATVVAERLERTGELASRGHGCVRSYLVRDVGVGAGRAGSLQGAARRLRRFPQVRDSWLAGDVHGDAVRILTTGVDRALADVPVTERRAAREDAVDLLLPIAATQPVATLATAIEHLRLVTDPEGAERRALRAYEEQFLDLTRVGEQFVVRGALDVPTGAALCVLLDRERDRQYRDGLLPAAPAPTGDPEQDEAAEARARRLAAPHQDALSLGRLVRAWLDDGASGSSHGAAPHITVLVTADDLDTDRPGELDIPGGSAPVLVPAETLRRLLCDADVTEIVTAGSVPDVAPTGCPAYPDLPAASRALLPRRHHVWDLGREHRTASARLWRALAARDRHCRFPGCHVGVSWCEAHHVLEWELGGETSLANMTLLCSRHHHLVHEGGWRLVADSDLDVGHPDRWTVHPPDERQP